MELLRLLFSSYILLCIFMVKGKRTAKTALYRVNSCPRMAGKNKKRIPGCPGILLNETILFCCRCCFLRQELDNLFEIRGRIVEQA